ncbi:MAG: haloacid dehalogenase-like hydrolase [Byssovorax sp.]
MSHVDQHAAIPSQTATEVIRRLESAFAAEPGGVLATDADGTIWDGDVGIDLFEALLASKGVRPAAEEALRAEAKEFGVEAKGSPTDLASALCAAHLTEQYPHDRAFAMMAWAFAGWTRSEVLDFARDVLRRGAIESRIRPAMREIFGWAARAEVPIYIVSASPIGIIEAAIGALGVPIAGALAMTPALDDEERIQPRLDGPVVYGEGKVKVLEMAGVASRLLGAFGDSAYDAAMLRVARVPVAVTPAPRLAALLPGIPGVSLLDLGR